MHKLYSPVAFSARSEWCPKATGGVHCIEVLSPIYINITIPRHGGIPTSSQKLGETIRTYLSKSAFLLPREIEFCIAQNIIDQRHVSPHVSFLTGIQRRRQGDALRVHKCDDRVHFGDNEGTSPDEGNLATGGHVLSIASHLDSEVQGSHMEKSLHCQAGGIVWQ